MNELPKWHQTQETTSQYSDYVRHNRQLRKWENLLLEPKWHGGRQKGWAWVRWNKLEIMKQIILCLDLHH